MHVECQFNRLEMIPSVERRKILSAHIRVEGQIDGLNIGRIYPVQAIKIEAKQCDFYVHAIEELNYPFPYPSDFFKVVNKCLPNNWWVQFLQSDSTYSVNIISFIDWVDDVDFYEKLIDGDEYTVSAYLQNRRIV